MVVVVLGLVLNLTNGPPPALQCGKFSICCKLPKSVTVVF